MERKGGLRDGEGGLIGGKSHVSQRILPSLAFFKTGLSCSLHGQGNLKHHKILVYMIRILTLISLFEFVLQLGCLTLEGFFGSIDDARRLFPS